MRPIMTAFDDWPWALKLVMLTGPFLMSMIGCGLSAFVAFTKYFDVAYKHMQGHPGLEQMKNFCGIQTGSTRWLVLTLICGILIYPGVHLRRGHLSAETLKSFPPTLKRILKISAWLTIVGLIWMIVTYAFIKLCIKT